MNAQAPQPISPSAPVFVLLATGGTIAGVANNADDAVGYTAGQRSAQELLASVPNLADALSGARLEHIQVAQVDSKDMSGDVWLALWRAAQAALARPEVKGVLITHGTDTLEETAYFLLRTLQEATQKPVVFTCAMRPATHHLADGPGNLRDALGVLRRFADRGVAGVWLVCAAQVHSARYLQKVHTSRPNAFSSEDGPAWSERDVQSALEAPWRAIFEEKERLAGVCSHSLATKIGASTQAPSLVWPRVELLVNAALMSGEGVRAWLRDAAAGHSRALAGIVVAGSGNGTSRCAFGGVVPAEGALLPAAQAGSPAKARVDLMLELL
jgi:L-asparaginase